MTAKIVKRYIVTGGLVTTLVLPAGAVLAQSRINPVFDLCFVEQHQEIALRSGAAPDPEPLVLPPALAFWDLLSVSSDPAEVTSAAAAPWFRTNLGLVRADGTCPVKPIEGMPPTGRLAKTTQPVLPEVQLPGTVQNLRRVDQR